MNINKLYASRAERKNISLLLGYLTSLIGTPLAAQYDHGSISTCTVGFAFRSNLFPVLNENLKYRCQDDDDELITVDTSAFCDIDDVIAAVFGSDYESSVVYGAGASYAYRANCGEAQLKAIIHYITKAYAIKPTKVPAVAQDATKIKIDARITVLEAYITAAKALGDDYRQSIIASVSQAETEINALKKVLAL